MIYKMEELKRVKLLEGMKTSDLLLIYYPLKIKEEKFKTVPVKFFIETFEKGNEEERGLYRRDMIDYIITDERKQKTVVA